MAEKYYGFASSSGGINTLLAGVWVGPTGVRYVGPVQGEPNLNNEPTATRATEGRIFTWTHITAVDFDYLYDLAGGDSALFAYAKVRAKKWGKEQWYDWDCMLIRPDRGEFWRRAGKNIILEVREMKNPVLVE